MKLFFELSCRLRRGKVLTIKPVTVCNYSCSYCSMDLGNKHWRKKGFLPWKVWTRILEENRVKEVNISGGEPLLYPKLDKLIRWCESRRMLINLVTNLSIYVKLPASWKLVIRATYHPGQVSRDDFLTMVGRYRADGHHVEIYEIGERTLPGSRVRKRQTGKIDKTVEVYGSDGRKYNNCYLNT